MARYCIGSKKTDPLLPPPFQFHAVSLSNSYVVTLRGLIRLDHDTIVKYLIKLRICRAEGDGEACVPRRYFNA